MRVSNVNDKKARLLNSKNKSNPNKNSMLNKKKRLVSNIDFDLNEDNDEIGNNIYYNNNTDNRNDKVNSNSNEEFLEDIEELNRLNLNLEVNMKNDVNDNNFLKQKRKNGFVDSNSNFNDENSNESKDNSNHKVDFKYYVNKDNDMIVDLDDEENKEFIEKEEIKLMNNIENKLRNNKEKNGYVSNTSETSITSEIHEGDVLNFEEVEKHRNKLENNSNSPINLEVNSNEKEIENINHQLEHFKKLKEKISGKKYATDEELTADYISLENIQHLLQKEMHDVVNEDTKNKFGYNNNNNNNDNYSETSSLNCSDWELEKIKNGLSGGMSNNITHSNIINEIKDSINNSKNKKLGNINNDDEYSKYFSNIAPNKKGNSNKSFMDYMLSADYNYNSIISSNENGKTVIEKLIENNISKIKYYGSSIKANIMLLENNEEKEKESLFSIIKTLVLSKILVEEGEKAENENKRISDFISNYIKNTSNIENNKNNKDIDAYSNIDNSFNKNTLVQGYLEIDYCSDKNNSFKFYDTNI